MLYLIQGFLLYPLELNWLSYSEYGDDVGNGYYLSQPSYLGSHYCKWSPKRSSYQDETRPKPSKM